MLKIFVSGLLVLISFFLQTCILPNIAVVRVIPNLFIILVASCGFMREEKAGLMIGFACGLLYDVFFCDVIGMYALIYMYIGYLNGKFSRVFYPEDIKLPLVLITVSDLTYSLVCYIMLFLLRGRLDFPFYFMHIILPEMISTLVITLIFYPIILKLDGLIQKAERKREQKFV